jgi:galactokinase
MVTAWLAAGGVVGAGVVGAGVGGVAVELPLLLHAAMASTPATKSIVPVPILALFIATALSS